MPKLLIVLISIALIPATVTAGGAGIIVPYWDFAGTNCLLPEPMPVGICHTYFYHLGASRANGSQFRVVLDRWNETMVAFNTGYVYTATSVPTDPTGGIIIDYGNPLCEPLPTLILDITWLCQGLSPSCANIRVGADPTAPLPGVVAFGCDDVPVLADGGAAFYGEPSCVYDYCWVPAARRTWSEIKALYD